MAVLTSVQVVTERSRGGKVVQKDVSEIEGLLEAIEYANNLRQVYRNSGWIEQSASFKDPGNGDIVMIYALL